MLSSVPGVVGAGGDVLNVLVFKASGKHTVLINLSVCFILTQSCLFCFGCLWGG